MNNSAYIIDSLDDDWQKDKSDIGIKLRDQRVRADHPQGTHIIDAIQQVGTGKCHLLLLFVAGSSLLSLVTELINMGFVVPSAKCEFDITATQQGVLLSIGFFGIVMSSHLWGFLTDTWGRKSSLQLALLSGFVFSVISAFSNSATMLIVTRFLTGFCVSGVQSASLIYLGEFHTDRTRAKAVTFAAMCMVLSLVYMAVVALIVLPNQFNIPIGGFIQFRPWRLDILICSSMMLLTFVVCVFLPESPQFLLSIGRNSDALDALRFVFAINTGKPGKELTVSDIYTDSLGTSISEVTLKDCAAIIWKQTCPIFKPPLFKNTMIMCYLSFVLFLIAHGMNTWLPRIFTDMISYVDESRTMCFIMTSPPVILNNIDVFNTSATAIQEPQDCTNTSNPQVYKILLIYTGGCMIIFVGVAMYMKKIGLKLVLIIWLLISAVTGIACAFVGNFYLFLFLIICFLSCGNCGCIVGAISQDLFPTHIRAMALCIIFMMGRIGSVIGSNIIGVLIAYNCNWIFFIYSGLLTSCAALCVLLPKTSGSKT